jgi:hypothetical protein
VKKLLHSNGIVLCSSRKEVFATQKKNTISMQSVPLQTLPLCSYGKKKNVLETLECELLLDYQKDME